MRIWKCMAVFFALTALCLTACQTGSLMNANPVNATSSASSSSSSSSGSSGSDASSSSSSAATADYYVSSTGSDSAGNGSMTSPWATIAHASAKAGPGAIVYVAAGVYNGSFTTNASGTSSAPITYQATNANFSAPVNCAQIAAGQGNLSACPQLVGSSGTTWTNNGNYVNIEGFDVSGPGLNGIYTQGNQTLIEGNHVHDVLTGTCNSDGGSGINLNGTNAEVVGNYVHNIGPYPTACGYVQGIYFLAAGGYAYNNISFNNSGFGIQLWHSPSDIQLVNNTIFNNASGGIVLGTDTSGFTVNYITVANNIVVNNGGVGISEQGAAASSTGLQNVYENNLVEGNAGGSFSLQNGLTATGTVTASPQFVNGTGNGSGNYHLLSTSPAIGAGTASGAPATDFDGNPRPQSGSVDIGAYQHTAASGSTGAAAPAAILLTPGTLEFPYTKSGRTSAAKYVTVTNTGGSALNFSSDFAISGPFAFAGTGTCTLTLAPHASCTISAVFKPKSTGMLYGAVTLSDNAGTGTQQIVLWGQG